VRAHNTLQLIEFDTCHRSEIGDPGTADLRSLDGSPFTYPSAGPHTVYYKSNILSSVKMVMIYSGASTPYKRWSKCSMESKGGEFCSLLQELRGEISSLIVTLLSVAN